MKTIIAVFTTLCCLLAADFARGQTWTLTGANTNYGWAGIALSADGTKIAATADQPDGIYLSTNSGASWVTSSAPAVAWESIASSADGTRLIAVAAGSVYVSTNSGGTWALSTYVGNAVNQVVSSADGSKLMAASTVYGGNISVSTNSGATWFLGANNGTALSGEWSEIACSADGTKMAAVVAQDGAPVYVSTNCGVTWYKSPPNFGQPGASIAWAGDGSRLMVADDGYFYVSTNCGLTWASTKTPNPLPFGPMVCSANGSTLISTTAGGSGASVIFFIVTSTNFGASWTTNNSPALSEGSFDPWESFACSADGNKLMAVGETGSNGQYSGQIWISQTRPSPQLNESLANGSLNLSWIVPSTNMVMEESPDLVNWTLLTNAPSLNDSNLQEQLAISPTNVNSFFRLVSQ